MKLDLAAPASFLSAAWVSHDGLAASAAVLANRLIAMTTRRLFMTCPFMFGGIIGCSGRRATRVCDSHMLHGRNDGISERPAIGYPIFAPTRGAGVSTRSPGDGRKAAATSLR